MILGNARIQRKNRLGVCMGITLAGLTSGLPAKAQSDQDQTTPTGWWWLSNATSDQVNERVNAGFRITDLEVVQASPIRFNAAFVENSGAYSKGWWWYYNADVPFLDSALTANNARLIDLERYEINGHEYFAAVMISNTGADAAGWWWVLGVSASDLSTFVNNNNARIIDLDTYVVSNTRYYNAVLIQNTGQNARSWWFYFNVTPDDISALLSANNARLVDLVPHSVAIGSITFDCVMVGSQGEHWWWYYNLTEDQVNEATDQNGARLIDVERYSIPLVGTRFAVVMLNNSNDLTTRVGEILRNGSDGFSGLYLKQVNGPVLAYLQGDRIFEPASMIKVLHHTHAFIQVRDNVIDLTDLIPTYSGNPTDCPQDTGLFNIQLQTALQQMMEQSHNVRTQAIRAYFGEANINATAQALGMTNTLLQHRIGCAAGPDGAIAQPNHFTLVDAGKLYEAVATGLLHVGRVDWKDTFYELMIDGLPGGTTAMITDEGTAAGMATAVEGTFRDLVYGANKGGSYGLCSPDCIYDQTRGGWIRIPFKNACGNSFFREYVYGTFVNNATVDDDAATAASTAFSEILRDQIRAAIDSWLNCTFDDNHDGDVDRADHRAFVDCMTGPGGRLTRGCENFDANGDNHVDLKDWSGFQREFSPNGQ
jgi:hypothetical protein